MQITNEAKSLLLDFLKEKNKKGFIFEANGQGCHTRLAIKSTDELENAELYNDILIQMDETSRASLDQLTIDVKDGHLVFMANCHGCHDGCDDECK